jgi:RNA polymerase sigma factor (sigma-70 family)
MLDKNILEGLFRQHYGKMIHLARTLLGNDAEAQDVVQDVFAHLLENEYQMTGNKTEAYLMSAVRNHCFNLIRKKNLRERVKNLYPIDETDNSQSIEEQMEKLEQINAFVQTQVEEPHRSIFFMRFDEDLTFKEIAERLGLNLSTVYKYLCQCIQQIRIHFNNE